MKSNLTRRHLVVALVSIFVLIISSLLTFKLLFTFSKPYTDSGVLTPAGLTGFGLWGILSFICSLLIFSSGVAFVAELAFKKQGLKLTVWHVMLRLFLAGGVSLIFLLLTLPFLGQADGLSFQQKANIGEVNIWRIVAIYGFLVGIFTAVSFWKRIVRLSAILLIGTWLAGAGFIVTISSVNKPPTSNIANQSVDNSNCDEQTALAKAKACTILVMSDLGFGSGFSVTTGYVLTNRHVVEGASTLYTWIDSNKVPLVLWGYSNDADIAVLKLDKEIPTCNWADSSSIGLAENLFTVGWPNAAEGESSITKGIYSRTLKSQEGPEFVQTDAAINPGNSGGPLVSKCGTVGVNTQKLVWSESYVPSEGFGFALASNYLKPLVEFLVNSGGPKSLPVNKIKPKIYTPEYVAPTSPPTDKSYPRGNNYDSGDRISGVSATAIGGGKVSVAWTMLNRSVLYYTVDYGSNSGGYDFSTSAGSNSSIEIGGLSVGSKMYFRVKAGWHEPNSVWKEAYGNEVSVVVK